MNTSIRFPKTERSRADEHMLKRDKEMKPFKIRKVFTRLNATMLPSSWDTEKSRIRSRSWKDTRKNQERVVDVNNGR